LAEPTRQVFQSLEDQTRKNMQMFRQALAMFNPFALGNSSSGAEPNSAGVKSSPSDIDDLKRQLEDMRERLDGLAKKS
jgi:polyhydroxyalkanoate synthesis regulator protein